MARKVGTRSRGPALQSVAIGLASEVPMSWIQPPGSFRRVPPLTRSFPSSLNASLDATDCHCEQFHIVRIPTADSLHSLRS